MMRITRIARPSRGAHSPTRKSHESTGPSLSVSNRGTHGRRRATRALTSIVVLFGVAFGFLAATVLPAAASLQSVTVGSQSGTATYSGGSPTFPVTVNQSSQHGVNITGISGGPSGTTFNSSGCLAVNGNNVFTVTVNVPVGAAPGTYTLVATATRYTDSSDCGGGVDGSTLSSSGSEDGTLTVGKGTQATLTVTSTSGTYLTPLTLATSGGSGTGAVSYAVVNGTATGCAITSGQLNSSSAGTCLVTATKAADSNYNATSSAQTTVTIGPANQATLTVTSTSGTYLTPLTLATSGGSGTGAVSYAVVNGTATGCAITSGQLNSSSAGTCLVTATKAADSNYNATSSAQTTVTIGPANQATLTVTSTSGTYLTPLTLATSGGSGTGAVITSSIPVAPPRAVRSRQACSTVLAQAPVS